MTAAGLMDTETGCFIQPEVGDAETQIQPRVKDQGSQVCREREVSAAQAGRDFGVHENVLRKWVRELQGGRQVG
jgi:transposase-like protein